MTNQDVSQFCANPLLYVFIVISVALGFLCEMQLDAMLKKTEGTEESIKKTNRVVKKIELFSLIIPAVVSIIGTVIVALINQNAGLQLSAFEGQPYYYYAMVVAIGCFGSFSMLFYVLFTTSFEQSLTWLPFKKEDTTMSFTRKIMVVVFFAMLSIVMFMEAIFYSPASRELAVQVLLINAVMPIALVVAAIGLINIYQVIKNVNRYIKMSIDLSGELSEKKYNTPDIPILIRNELALFANSLNGLKHSTSELLGNFKESVDSSTNSAARLQREMATAYENINAINGNIQSVSDEMSNQSAGVEEASAAINQIIGRTEELNQNIEKQTEALNQSSSAVEEMVANIRSVTQILEHNAEAVEELGTASDEGRNSVNLAVNTSQEILKQSEAVLEASSIIQTIARQTNLLAMNAAIESAHAGEAGRGFAVVADEIRKLAEQSSNQGKNISTNLKGLSGAIQLVANNTREVQQKFDKIYELTKTVKDQEAVVMNSMSEQAQGNQQVLDAMRNINDITASVSDGSVEMLSGGKQIVDEMNALTDVTRKITDRMNEMAGSIQSVSSAMRNVASASEDNQDQIDNLGVQINQFEL
ncbi:MAG: hypothetical protein KBT02_01385 [Treponema sp.]|nr:hypothetical protein [Candidatus Treponema caballi]